MLAERSLSSAEKKKKEEIVLALKRDNPDWPKEKIYAIATARAKEVAESLKEQLEQYTQFDIEKAKAALKGLSQFSFEGRIFPVNINIEQARAILSDKASVVAATATQGTQQVTQFTNQIAKGAMNHATIGIPRRLGKRIIDNTLAALNSPTVKGKIMAGLKAAGYAAIPISVVLALAYGGRFAWRKFLRNKKHKDLARAFANDDTVRRELELTTTISLDDLGANDSESMERLISDLEKYELRSGIDR